MAEPQPEQVTVYGVDHSPWVQAVLLGLHDAGIKHTLTTVPPREIFLKSGVRMPAASFDGGPWQLESADILERLGYGPVTAGEKKRLSLAWQGVMHRPDSAALFWGGFSLAGDRSPSRIRRLWHNFLRSFVALYMFLLIRTLVLLNRPPDPADFGDQFLPFEERLEKSDGPFLGGGQPDTLDFLLFGIIQCHCSIYVPPVTALQTDPRLARTRAWIAAMHERFRHFGHLYSGLHFAPHAPPPAVTSGADRIAFWLGAILMLVLFPITVPLVAFLAIRNRRR